MKIQRTEKHQSWILIMGIGLLVVGVAGCGTSALTPVSTNTPTSVPPTSTPTATPTPTPVAEIPMVDIQGFIDAVTISGGVFEYKTETCSQTAGECLVSIDLCTQEALDGCAGSIVGWTIEMKELSDPELIADLPAYETVGESFLLAFIEIIVLRSVGLFLDEADLETYMCLSGGEKPLSELKPHEIPIFLWPVSDEIAFYLTRTDSFAYMVTEIDRSDECQGK